MFLLYSVPDHLFPWKSDPAASLFCLVSMLDFFLPYDMDTVAKTHFLPVYRPLFGNKRCFLLFIRLFGLLLESVSRLNMIDGQGWKYMWWGISAQKKNYKSIVKLLETLVKIRIFHPPLKEHSGKARHVSCYIGHPSGYLTAFYWNVGTVEGTFCPPLRPTVKRVVRVGGLTIRLSSART